MTPIPKPKAVLRACGLAAALAAGLAGCDTKQIGAPVPTGVQWTRITNATSTPYPNAPDWRGDSLAFYFTNKSGFARMATSGLDGSSLTYLPAGAARSNDGNPRWVDDSTIVFTSNRTTPDSLHYDIWYYTTTNQQLLRLSDTGVNEWTPVPRPGSDGLVYMETPTLTAGLGRITLIPQARSLPDERYYLTPASLKAADPGWDPAGQKVCFDADSTGGTQHIWVVSLTDTIPRQITTGPFVDGFPCFSPDGTRILFTSNRTGRPGLWTIAPSGDPTSLKLVVFEDKGRHLLSSCWSPDGTRIVVVSDGHNYPQALWLLSDLP
ncbi:MAG: TolB family protein [Bacteroidota bacterium]